MSTNWQSHTVLLLLPLFYGNSSCNLLECPVSLLYFSFLFVFLSGSEPSVGGKGACWESHVPYLNIEGTVNTFHSWAIELVWSSNVSGSSAAPNSGNSSFNTSVQEKQECSSQAKTANFPHPMCGQTKYCTEGLSPVIQRNDLWTKAGQED